MAEWLCSGLQLRVHRFDSVLSLHIMKILVTGASGFIGYHLVKSLLKNDHRVIGIDNHNDYYDPALKELRNKNNTSKNYELFKQDINNINLKKRDFDLAINLAAQAGVRIPKKNEYLYKHTNINGFKSFCNFCKNNNINKIIYASSSSVYSDFNYEKFSETSKILEPKSEYGASKLSNEAYANKFAKKEGIKFIGLRFFTVYGPFGRPDMAYYSFTDSLKNNKKIFLNNNGKMLRDMTYIDDIIKGIMLAIDFIFKKSNEGRNEIFNLGNDSPISTKFLLETLENKLNTRANIEINFTSNELLRTHADISKAKNLLGYDPKISFNDGIKEFLIWHKTYYENK